MKNHKLAAPVLLLALSSTGCAITNAPDTHKAFFQASLADIATTTAVIASGAGVEANPIGFFGSTVAKAAIHFYAKDRLADEQKQIYKTSTSFFAGAAVNNLLVLVGASTGVSVLAGVASAIAIYTNNVSGDQK